MTTLKDLRSNAQLTQRQLAELVGVSQRTIIHWEMGTASPSFEGLRKLIEVLGPGAHDAITPTRTYRKRGRKPEKEQEQQE